MYTMYPKKRFNQHLFDKGNETWCIRDMLCLRVPCLRYLEYERQSGPSLPCGLRQQQNVAWRSQRKRPGGNRQFQVVTDPTNSNWFVYAPGLDLYEEMQKFYQEFYSANGMTLSVIGQESISELEANPLDLEMQGEMQGVLCRELNLKWPGHTEVVCSNYSIHLMFVPLGEWRLWCERSFPALWTRNWIYLEALSGDGTASRCVWLHSGLVYKSVSLNMQLISKRVSHSDKGYTVYKCKVGTAVSCCSCKHNQHCLFCAQLCT